MYHFNHLAYPAELWPQNILRVQNFSLSLVPQHWNLPLFQKFHRIVPFLRRTLSKLWVGVFHVKLDVFWCCEKRSHVVLHGLLVWFRKGLREFWKKLCRLRLYISLFLIEHLLHLQLFLHFRLVHALNEFPFPLVALFVDEYSFSVHFVIDPLSLVSAAFWELVKPYPIVLIISKLPSIYGSRFVDVNSFSAHLIIFKISSVLLLLVDVGRQCAFDCYLKYLQSQFSLFHVSSSCRQSASISPHKQFHLGTRIGRPLRSNLQQAPQNSQPF